MSGRARHQTHVVLEGVAVWVDLDELHLAAVLAVVLVEFDETRLVGADVVDPPGRVLSLAIELAPT
jgi:hypothetical protein